MGREVLNLVSSKDEVLGLGMSMMVEKLTRQLVKLDCGAGQLGPGGGPVLR